jgi:3-oxoacyl-[acyl-carrier protein] reductase
MDSGVEGKVFVVTGGTGGLGLATAQELVAAGSSVVVSGRDQRRVDAAVAQLGPQSTGIAADNAAAETAGRLVAAAVESFGRLDGACISVGGPPTGTALETSDETWHSAFDSVFVGSLRIARTVAGAIGEGGSIAFVLSSSVRAPVTNLAVSNGLRPGLAMVAKTLADELGPRGIRVNGLLPGRVATDRVAEIDAASGDADAARAAAIAGIPLGRYGDPAEFAQAALFLLSDRSSFVTGVMLPVDGGMLRAL